MNNSCPFPKSTMVTDLMVNCETNVLTVVQTSPAGTESKQSVDLTCIVDNLQNSRITDAVYDCENDQIIITQETEGSCDGPSCTETFIIDLGCITDGMMPACSELSSVTPAPVGSELVVCAPGGAFKTAIGGIITELDCSLLPPVCCPRPPLAEFIVCNEGELSRLPAADIFTCDDVAPYATLATNPMVMICDDRGMGKVPLVEVQPKCADYPLQDPSPAGHTLLACDGDNLISILPTTSRATVIVEGDGIDIGLIAGADTDTYTVTLDLCELQVDTYENLSNPGPVYMAVCANGNNYKMPYVETDPGTGETTVLTDGVGTSLSGDGTAGDPYKIDLALCEVSSNVTYDETAEVAACLGGLNTTMPAIKAGQNVIIDSNGTLNVPTITGVTEFLGTPIPLWDVNFDSGVDPNHSATVDVSGSLGSAYKGIIVDITMDGYVKTSNSSGSLEKILLQALINGVQFSYWAATIIDGGNGVSNQFSAQFILPYDGSNSVDVALNWAFLGTPTSEALVTAKANIVGVILA